MKKRNRAIGGYRVGEHMPSIKQIAPEVVRARQKWLERTVSFDLGQGQGVQYGKVTSISNEGDVLVECFPVAGQRARALAMSLGYLDLVLTLVEQ
jgi:hypothetical protein